METNGAILNNSKGRDYFLSLDDESKQRCKVKIHNIQECNLH